MDAKEVLKRLEAATEPSRILDAAIAKALGFKWETKTRDHPDRWLSPNGDVVQIPRYTASIDAAYQLALTVSNKGGASWDGTTAAARIGYSVTKVAATMPLAICLAIFSGGGPDQIQLNGRDSGDDNLIGV